MLVVGARRGEWGYIVRHSLGAGKDVVFAAVFQRTDSAHQLDVEMSHMCTENKYGECGVSQPRSAQQLSRLLRLELWSATNQGRSVMFTQLVFVG